MRQSYFYSLHFPDKDLLDPRHSWTHVGALLAGSEIVYKCVEVDDDDGGGMGVRP